MQKFKWIAFALILALLTIIVFQNLEQTEVHLLFWTVGLPRAALLTATLAVGFLLGFSGSFLWKVHAWRVRNSKAKKEAAEHPQKDSSGE